MDSFSNQNIIKLIFNTLSKFKSKQTFLNIKSTILIETLLPTLYPVNIIESLGTTKITFNNEHRGNIYSLALLQDGNIASSSDNILKVWNTESGSCLWTLTEDSFIGYLLSIPNRNFISISPKGKLRVYNISDYYSHVKTMDLIGFCEVDNMLLLPNGNIVCSAIFEKTPSIVVLDPTNEYCYLKVITISFDVYMIINLEDKFVTGSRDTIIRVWSVGNYKLLNSIIGHDESIVFLFYNKKARHLISQSMDLFVKMWDVSKCFDCIQKVKLVDFMLLGFPGGYMAANVEGQFVLVNNNIKCIRTLEENHEDFSLFALLKDDRVITAGCHGKIIVWNY
jgi:WD40 repeat protein